jgi:hypothetical protein
MFKFSRQLILLTLLAALAAGAHATEDARLTIDQTFVDRVVTDLSYPNVLIDADVSCDPSTFKSAKLQQGTFSAADLVAAASQKENKETLWSQQVLQWADEWKMEIESIETNKKAILGQNKPWIGPNDQEMADAKAMKLPIAACVTHERVTLDKKPAIQLSPPGVLLTIPSISAHAHVKIFVWNPFHHCTKQVCFLGVCLCYSWSGGWDQLGGGFDVGTDHATASGKLAARASGPQVFFDPEIDKLRFASPWDWIPLEKFVNGALQPLQILDVRDIKIPVLGMSYIGKTATITTTAGAIGIAVELKKQ